MKEYSESVKLILENQLKSQGIKDKAIINVMNKVKRHLFVKKNFVNKAYKNSPLPIGYGQTISQPYIVAKMTQELDISKKDRVLEIGTGSGYQTAILSQMAAHVYSVERIYELYKKAVKLFDLLKYNNISCIYGNGYIGLKKESPFDAIIVAAAAKKIPPLLLDQLATGGKMIIPLGNLDIQRLIKIHKKTNGEISRTEMLKCRFVELIDID